MLIGDSVMHDGHTYVIVGFTPASVRPSEVQLTEPQTGMTFWLEMSLFRELGPIERAALRVVPPEGTSRR